MIVQRGCGPTVPAWKDHPAQGAIGAPPIAISYPVGSVNDVVVDEAKRTGYRRLGLATGQRVYDTAANADLFRIPRIELYNENWWKTRMRISGHLEIIKKWIHH